MSNSNFVSVNELFIRTRKEVRNQLFSAFYPNEEFKLLNDDEKEDKNSTIFPFSVKSNQGMVLFDSYKSKAPTSTVSNIKNIYLFHTGNVRPNASFLNDSRIVFVRLSVDSDQRVSIEFMGKVLKIERMVEPIFEKTDLVNFYANTLPDRNFYKYKRLEQSNGGEEYSTINAYAKSAISQGEVFFSPPKYLNDPFEFMLLTKHDLIGFMIKLCITYNLKYRKNLSFQKEYLVLRKYIESNVKIEENIDKLSWNEISMYAINHYTESKNNQCLLIAESIKTTSVQQQEDARVLSLANNHLDIIMWSHYGDGHKGICLKYGMSDILNGIENEAQADKIYYGDVNYSKKRPSEDDFLLYQLFFREDYALELYKINVLFTKYSGWSYEGEYRFLAFTKSPNNLYINVQPKTIYLGCNSNASLLSSCVTKASFQKIYKDDNKYELHD